MELPHGHRGAGHMDVLGQKKAVHWGLSSLFQTKCPMILGHSREIWFYKTEETLKFNFQWKITFANDLQDLQSLPFCF